MIKSFPASEVKFSSSCFNSSSSINLVLIESLCQASDLNNADILNARSITFNSEVTITPAGSPVTATADWTAGQKQKITITTATTVSFTAPTGQSNLTLKITNGGTGTITWPGTVKWPGGTEPTWTTTGTDIASFYYDGTDYYGMAGLAFA